MLEKLSYIGTFVASVGNLGLVLFASIQLIFLRRQVKVAQDQVDVATRAMGVASESATAANEGVVEALRARIDDRAPRIVVVMESPQWPPLVDRAGCAVLSNSTAMHRKTKQSYEASAEVPFYLQEHQNWALWFRVRGLVINEGEGTARVRLDDGAYFVESSSPFLPTAGLVQVPPLVGSIDRQEYLLRPGDYGVIEWDCCGDLGVWASAYQNLDSMRRSGVCVLTISIADSFEQGIVDTIFVEVFGRPLEPIKRVADQWRVRRNLEEAQIGVKVYPTQRVYWTESGRVAVPSWGPTYLRSHELVSGELPNSQIDILTGPS